MRSVSLTGKRSVQRYVLLGSEAHYHRGSIANTLDEQCTGLQMLIVQARFRQIFVKKAARNWLTLVFGEPLKNSDVSGTLLQKPAAGGGKECRLRPCFPYWKD